MKAKGNNSALQGIIGHLIFLLLILPSFAVAGELNLSELLREALQKSPEILASDARATAGGYRIPQVKSLPDPMVSIGYQNDNLNRYNYGESGDAYWMYSVSQTFPFYGKRFLKGEMAASDADGLKAVYEGQRLKVIAKVKELYYELSLIYKNLDLIKGRTEVFKGVEDAALARYAAGKGMQQEVIMAQTEKYMIMEKEAMLQQRRESVEAMINLTVGRETGAPLGRPAPIAYAKFDESVEDLIGKAMKSAPELRTKEKMVAAAETRVKMAKREYYPDFTVTAGFNQKGTDFTNMWSLSTAMNIPLYFTSKQRPAVAEAEASLREAKHDLNATRLMVSSNIRDNYAMMSAASRLMGLYKNAIGAKAAQDYEVAMSGYAAGRLDLLTAMTRLKTFLDVETLYWIQWAEGQKAKARIEAAIGAMDPELQTAEMKK